MKIYVITHKKFKPVVNDSKLYQPMLVGAALGNQGLNDYIRDDTKENISSKNRSYCELTGLYWIWKNSEEKVVGIDHYRRYFVEKNNKLFHRYLTSKYINTALKEYDMILPKREEDIYNNQNAKDFFINNHGEEAWNKTRNILAESYPDYVEDFDWFAFQKSGYCYNMMICKKEIFDEYCEWLFGVLAKLEKRMDLTQYDNYNQRMYGFVSERLINVWIHNKALRVKECPIYFDDGKSIFTKIKEKIAH